MTTLTHLLTLATRDAQNETAAKWRNAHRARCIRGQYTEGDMIKMAVLTHRSTSTLYKWAGAAEVYSSLVRAVFAEVEPAARRFAWDILRRAGRELSPWFFAALYPHWRRDENLWNCLQDLAVACESGWSIGTFTSHLWAAYTDNAPTPLEQAEAALDKALQLFQTLTGDGEAEMLKRTKARLAAHIMNGAHSLACPDCQHEIALERWAETWKE